MEDAPLISSRYVQFAVAVLIVVAILGALLGPMTVEAQDGKADRLAFDVASIKPNTSGGTLCTSIAFSCYLDLAKPGIVTATNKNVRDLIGAAYHLTSAQLKIMGGAPKWAETARFNIEARAEGNPSIEQKRVMLRALLAERFKLVVHQTTRRGPVYALVPANTGSTAEPGLRRHSSVAKCIDLSAGPPPGPLTPGSAFCGGTLVLNRGGLISVVGNNVTMDGLAEQFSGFDEIDRTVINRTRLEGTFDISLEYSQVMGPHPSSTDVDPSAPPVLPEALKEQLGLKLESTKGPVETLVIDHIERPSPN